jgi:hypothetical protein
MLIPPTRQLPVPGQEEVRLSDSNNDTEVFLARHGLLDELVSTNGAARRQMSDR